MTAAVDRVVRTLATRRDSPLFRAPFAREATPRSIRMMRIEDCVGRCTSGSGGVVGAGLADALTDLIVEAALLLADVEARGER